MWCLQLVENLLQFQSVAVGLSLMTQCSFKPPPRQTQNNKKRITFYVTSDTIDSKQNGVLFFYNIN